MASAPFHLRGCSEEPAMSSVEANIPRLSYRHSAHIPLAYLAAGCFVGGLLTDLTYMRSAEMTWADFSAWLVSAGAIVGIATLVVSLFDLLKMRRQRRSLATVLYALFSLVALVLGILNMFVHSRDAWTSVMPWGVALSALTSILVICAAISRWSSLSDPSTERIPA